MAYVPLAAAIRRVLDERSNHRARRCASATSWRTTCRADYAEETLHAVIAWGRYAELFAYDEEADQFSLEQDIDAPA